jgi:uncharacterized FlaG/YvyC family protein
MQLGPRRSQGGDIKMSYGAIDKVEAISGLRRVATLADAAPVQPKKDEQATAQPEKQAKGAPEAKAERQSFQSALAQTYVRFIIDNDSHRVRVQVLDSSNDEVIREIPPEDLVKMAADLRAYNQSVVDHRG